MLIRYFWKKYQKTISSKSKKLTSISLSNKEIKSLEDPKYNLTQFEIFLFIKVSDLLFTSGEFKLSLSKGIRVNHNKFRNVLIDLFYQNISEEAIFDLPISSLFPSKSLNI